MDYVGHAKTHTVSIAVLAQSAQEDPVETRRSIPRIVLAIDPAIYYLCIHACSGEDLADLIDDQDIQRHGNASHPGFGELQELFLFRLHLSHRNGGELGGIVIRVFEDREAAKDFPALEHLASNGSDNVLEAEPVRISVITLRAGKLAEPDRHH